MCGIAGIVGLNGAKVPEKNIVTNMLVQLAHRGPDDSGLFYSSNCAIGNTRLSIIDLKTGHQPISSDNDRFTIVYNGEIYNYKEVRRNLSASSKVFKTESDTEVILKGFILKGVEILNELNGIFSFAIWDKKNKSLFLARDHMGIKPLYYMKSREHYIFGSEIKAIFASEICEKQINQEAIPNFFFRQSPDYLQTMYNNIHELEPGTWMQIENNGNFQKGKYFSLENDWKDLVSVVNKNNNVQSFVEDKLRQSVQRQLVSDVPVGISLSGGIDSSLILNFMCEKYTDQIHAFTYTNSSKGINELSKAVSMVKSIDFDINHHVLPPISIDDHLNYFSEACRLLDAPVSYPSSVPILMISRLAKKKGVKVLLNGQGSDELFLGYERYIRWIKQGLVYSQNTDEWANHLYFGMGINNIHHVENLTKYSRDIALESSVYKWIFDHQELKPLKRMAIFDQKFRILDLLKRDDRMGMGGSVEIRVPFFDKEMVLSINALDDTLKINNLIQKFILKKIAQNKLPSNIVNAPKMGSPTDIVDWIRTPEFISVLTKLVSRKESFSKNFLAYDYVIKIISEHEKTPQFSHLCWCLFSMERWYQNSF